MNKRAQIIFILGAICIVLLIVGSSVLSDGAEQATDSQATINPDGSRTEVVEGEDLLSDPLVTVVPNGLESGIPRPLPSDPKRGAEAPLVTIMEFGDFECPACRDMSLIIEVLLSEYPSDLQHVWKDFPIPRLHEYSEVAAMAARCAQDQDAFWEYHDELFMKQGTLALRPWKEIAADLSLDQEQFDTCISSNVKKQLVVQGYYIARTVDIQEAPAFYINDTYVSGGKTIDELRVIIDQEIAEAKSEI